MKGQVSLTKLLEGPKPVIATGTRFLWRDHGSESALWEGTLFETFVDAEDGGQLYVRVDNSGEWMKPNQVFVECILPAHPFAFPPLRDAKDAPPPAHPAPPAARAVEPSPLRDPKGAGETAPPIPIPISQSHKPTKPHRSHKSHENQ